MKKEGLLFILVFFWMNAFAQNQMARIEGKGFR